MSGENPRWPVNPLDPPVCLTKQQLWDYWNGDLTEQKHMRDLIETIFCEIDEVDTEQTLEGFVVVCSTEDTPLDVANGLVTWRIPYAFELETMYAELTTAQSSGDAFTVDIMLNGGGSIFSTPITIDNGQTDSATAVAPPVLSTTTLAARDRFRIDITQLGDGTATGLKVTFIGRQIV